MKSGFVWGFADESSQHINVSTARVWSVGKAERRVNSDRTRANTFGFYAMRGNSVVTFRDESKAEDMCAFLDSVRRMNGGKHILMILDNGAIHHARKVTAHAEEIGITLVFLPPYSPQFNPIEFIWKSIKARISNMFILTKGRLIETVRSAFYDETRKDSYAAGWKRTFLIDDYSKKLGS